MHKANLMSKVGCLSEVVFFSTLSLSISPTRTGSALAFYGLVPNIGCNNSGYFKKGKSDTFRFQEQGVISAMLLSRNSKN